MNDLSEVTTLMLALGLCAVLLVAGEFYLGSLPAETVAASARPPQVVGTADAGEQRLP